MDILKVIAGFDLITPVVGIIRDVANSPSRSFEMAEDAGWSGRGVQRLLRRNGIKSWAWMSISHRNGIIFHVKKCDADEAFRVMRRNGVSLR